MHATITHFATCLPDWNSLDSVRRAHSDLEAAALVFFALLVLCEALAHLSDDKKTERRFDRIGIVFFAIAVLAEIAAYPYGQRNDTLSAQIIGSLDVKARDAASNASTALAKSKEAETKSSDALDKSKKAIVAVSNTLALAHEAQQEALAVKKDVEKVAKRQRPHLLDPKRFVSQLEGKPKSRVELLYNPYDSEAWDLAIQIYASLGQGTSDQKGAGWVVSIPLPIPLGAGMNLDRSPEMRFAPPSVRFDGAHGIFGITFLAKSLSPDPPALDPLWQALFASISPHENAFISSSIESDNSLPDDVIEIVVGPKPAFALEDLLPQNRGFPEVKK